MRRHENGEVDDAILLGADELLTVEDEDGHVAVVHERQFRDPARLGHFRHLDEACRQALVESEIVNPAETVFRTAPVEVFRHQQGEHREVGGGDGLADVERLNECLELHGLTLRAGCDSAGHSHAIVFYDGGLFTLFANHPDYDAATMKSSLFLAVTLLGVGLQAGSRPSLPQALVHARFVTGRAAMAALTVAAGDSCDEKSAPRVSSSGVWVDGRYEHELLLFPASGRDRYDTLLGPFAAGPHHVELRSSTFWPATACLRPERADVQVVEAGGDSEGLLRHSPVIELRADTVGEQTDAPLYQYVEEFAEESGRRTLRYTVVFSNEDGGTQTRALFARWGRTADIEQVYQASLENGRVVREEFQGPDHETRAFAGRRRGAAPILLVATLNNMVTDRGRGIAAVRPVPERVELSRATRESTLDTRPWASRIMARELSAEGHVAASTPMGDRWLREAPDPRHHVYLEAHLTLDRALAAAWVADRGGRRSWSNYERASLAIDRSGWVRTSVALGADPGSAIAGVGWACLPAPGPTLTGQAAGSCVVDATRAFLLGEAWAPGLNLVEPKTVTLKVGQEVTLPPPVMAQALGLGTAEFRLAISATIDRRTTSPGLLAQH